MSTHLSHVGIRVSDIRRSARFSCEALGFEEAEPSSLDTATRTTFGADMDFVSCSDPDGTSVELMEIPS